MMKNIKHDLRSQAFDVCVVGTGMGSLTAASLLARDGLSVCLLERNWLPGGCTSSYWRKGFVFEAGATTLVGLDESMPLRALLDRVGVEIEAVELPLPMRVQLADGTWLDKPKSLEAWIAEAERAFGPKGQRPFWEFCYRVSRFVWETSLKQTRFPPGNFADLWRSARNADLRQFRYAGYALMSMKTLLKRYGLLDNRRFVDFCNEQLLITAQNHVEEVNVLFGATALCYTNYSNYYVNGGLINLVNPLVDYLKGKGAHVELRTAVERVERTAEGHYAIQAVHKRKERREFAARYLVSGVPINNTLDFFGGSLPGRLAERAMPSEKLNSAFQMGIGFRKRRDYETLHYQLHLGKPLPGVPPVGEGPGSIFLSLSHPEDASRADEPGMMVGSVSTHVPDPAKNVEIDKDAVEAAILDRLEEAGLVFKEDVAYQHSSTPHAWEKWTGRAFGFVGGYPQFMSVKPWQMLEARLDGQGAYLCGDTAYPGQGIPGATLSGIVAYEKLKADHF